MSRLLGRLPAELRLAALAAAGLAVSLLLPWYAKHYVPAGAREFVADDVSAFGVFSWVEAALLLVAAGVLVLVWARREGRAFHLPGGDGAAITAAGLWGIVLLTWRVFDRPAVEGAGATVGLQWGMLGALAAAGALVAAGARVRAAVRPEPPNPMETLEWEPAPRRPERPPGSRAAPREHTAVTEALSERPGWEGEPPGAAAPPH